MDPIYVKPRPLNPKKPDAGALQVRRLDGRPIAPEGAWVEPTPYIRRRLRDGDLVPGQPPAKRKKAGGQAETAKAETTAKEE